MISSTLDYNDQIRMTRKKPPTRPLNIRVPLTLLERIEKAATAEDRSMNYVVIRCLEQCFPDTAPQPDRTADTPAPYPDKKD